MPEDNFGGNPTPTGEVPENLDYKAKWEEAERKRLDSEEGKKRAESIIESERARRLKHEEKLKELGEFEEENKGLSADEVAKIVAQAVSPIADALKKSQSDQEELMRTMISKNSRSSGEGAGAPPVSQKEETVSGNEVDQARTMLRNLGANASENAVKALAERLKTGEKLSFDEIGRITNL